MAPSTSGPSSSKSGISAQSKMKRNARERKRVDQVNQGFVMLRQSVPKDPKSKVRMSKVETLREAARYIQHLLTQLGMEMPVDFQTPKQSPNYPLAMHLVPEQTPSPSFPPSMLVEQTPSPSHVSPYYPPPQQTISHHRYYENPNSSVDSSSSNCPSTSTSAGYFSNDDAF